MRRSWIYSGLGSFLVSLTLLLTILFPVFTKEHPVTAGETGGNVVGNTIYWENSYANLSVYPHTSNEIITQTQYANLTWNATNTNIDVAFRFGEQLAGEKHVWLWRNISHLVQVPDYGNIVTNYTLHNIVSYTVLTGTPTQVDFGDIPSLHYIRGTYVVDLLNTTMNCTIGYDTFQWLNQNHTMARFNYTYYGIIGYHTEQRYWFDWDEITSSFSYLTYQGKHYYYIQNIPVVQNKVYHVKWQYNTPVNSKGKWELLAKLSSDTIATAFSTGRYVMIDPWWDSDWSYSKKITIDHTKVGATLTNFPVLIQNTSADFASHARSDGYDFRVLNSDNTTEYYIELVNYSSATGAINELWVNVTSVSSSTDTVLWLYYGHADASVNPSSTSTWNGNYSLVQHMNASSGTIYDSTSNNNDGTAVGTPDYAFAGKISNAIDFTPSEGFNLGTGCDIAGPITIESWIKVPDGGGRIISCKADNTGYPRTWTVNLETDDKMRFFRGAASSWVSVEQTDSAFSAWNTWTYVVARWYTTDSNIYYNMAAQATTLIAGTYTGTPSTTGLDIHLGWIPSTYYMDGTIDEVRVSKVDLGVNWLYATYNTSSSPSTFASYGAEQTKPAGNTVPVITASSQNPANQTTGVTTFLGNRYSHFNITVSDIDDATQNMNITWMTNESGSWTTMGTNTSINNGTYYCTNVSWVDTSGKKYWWNVSVNDGCGGWDNETYYFTTWLNTAPLFSSEVPTNETTDENLYPQVNITITDPNTNQTLTIDFFYSFSDSPYSWTHVQHNTSIGSSPVIFRDMNASYANAECTQYWWKITANDGMVNVSEINTFTTAGPIDVVPSPSNGSTGIGYSGGVTTNLTTDGCNDSQRYNIRFNDNLSGYWLNYGANHSVLDGTYRWLNPDFDTAGTTYWWQTRISIDQYAYFESNGSSHESFSNVFDHGAYYANGVTYVSYGGIDGDPFITCFNHTTGQWAPAVKIGTNPLTDDDHGVPNIVVNETGYIHCWYGAHNSPIEYAISSNPYDITSWDDQDNIGTAGTYPEPVLLDNGTIILFYRHQAGGADRPIQYRASWDSFATAHTIADFNKANWLYCWGAHLNSNGTWIYVVWNWYDNVDNIQDIYCAYLKLSDGKMYSMDSTDLGTTVNETEADASCSAYDSGDLKIQGISLDLDENDYPYIVFSYNAASHKFIYWDGDSWTVPATIVATDSATNNNALIVWNSTDVDDYLISSGSGGTGGNVELWHWDGVSWSRTAYLINETSYPFLPVNRVENITKTNEIKCVSGECDLASFSTMEKVYAFGEGYTVGIPDPDLWQNDTWHFTTSSGETTWQVINNSLNGSIWNQTASWISIDNTLNGSVYNVSSWVSFSTSINGSIYNNTGTWQVISSTINGSFYNTSTWDIIDLSINGTIYNNTGTWTVISSTINGSIYNNTGIWTIINSDVNGSIYNSTGWISINSSLNGSIYNTTAFYAINTSINGTIYNSSGVWQEFYKLPANTIYNLSSWMVFNTSINGSIYNTSTWTIIDTAINGSIYNITYATDLELIGLTDTWNITWNGTIPSGSEGVHKVWCNNSGTRYETIELHITVNDTMYVDYIDLWAIFLNNTVDNEQIYADNITVWVSDDNLTWGILQDDAGYGMGRFPTVSGSLTWNWSTNPVGVDLFSYIPMKGFVIASNTTAYVRYQLNITDTASQGNYYNQSGSDWQISIGNNSGGLGPGIVDTEHHNCKAVIEARIGVWQVINNTIDGSIYNTTMWVVVNTTINGSVFNTSAWHVFNNTMNGSIYNTSGTSWTIINSTLNGSIYNTSIWFIINNTVNGSIYNTSSWLDVNTTINGSIYNASLITPQLSNPVPANRSINVPVTTVSFCIDVTEPDGDLMDITINYVGAWSQTVFNQVNGTQCFLYISDLPCGTNITMYVNATDGTHWTNASYWFITELCWGIINDTINGTIYNLSEWIDIDATINGTILNTSTWFIINNSLNGSIYNASVVQWTIINQTINGTLSNTTITWHIINSSINGSIYNTSIVEWTAINTSINGTVYNSTVWTAFSTNINGSIYNVSTGLWVVFNNTINGAIYNSTTWRSVSITINGSIYNLSVWTIINVTNGTIFNISTGIQIINVYPVNQTHIIKLQPSVHFTLFNSTGSSNYIVYTGNSTTNVTHYLFNDTNVGNITAHGIYFNATTYYEPMYWKVCVLDGGKWTNETYWFTIIHDGGGGGLPGNSTIIGLLGLFGVLGILGLFIRKRRMNQR